MPCLHKIYRKSSSIIVFFCLRTNVLFVFVCIWYIARFNNQRSLPFVCSYFFSKVCAFCVLLIYCLVLYQTNIVSLRFIFNWTRDKHLTFGSLHHKEKYLVLSAGSACHHWIKHCHGSVCGWNTLSWCSCTSLLSRGWHFLSSTRLWRPTQGTAAPSLIWRSI